MVILTPCIEESNEKLQQYIKQPKKQNIDLWFHTDCGENIYMGKCVLEVEEQKEEKGIHTYHFKFHDFSGTL